MISRCKKHRLFPRLRLGFNGCETCWRIHVGQLSYRCPHFHWVLGKDGRTFCANPYCGVETTDMEAMGG